MNMYPLNDEALRREHALNREPLINARAEQHRLLAEAGMIRRTAVSRQVFRWSEWLGRLFACVYSRAGSRSIESGHRASGLGEP